MRVGLEGWVLWKLQWRKKLIAQQQKLTNDRKAGAGEDSLSIMSLWIFSLGAKKVKHSKISMECQWTPSLNGNTCLRKACLIQRTGNNLHLIRFCQLNNSISCCLPWNNVSGFVLTLKVAVNVTLILLTPQVWESGLAR